MNLQDLVLKDTVTISQNLENNTITLDAGCSSQKLSDIIKDFPDNCYVNKQITGCGGTTLVLRNDIDYVVLVPYVNLLKSKIADNKNYNVLGIYGETATKDIAEYLQQDGLKKIICTFDSLPRLMATPGFSPSNFKLLVDEAHTLVNLGSFKASTCEYVLRNYTQFKSYVFLTATPTKREYFPESLATLPLCTVNWSDVRVVKFNLQQIEEGTGLNNSLFGLCLDYLLGKVEGNAHIFYNSVTELTNVLNKLKKLEDKETKKFLIDPSNIRVVCSAAKANQKTFNSKLGIAWGKIGDINDPVAKINFYTSTAFEGADIYDKEGHTYIIINGARDSTKVDFHVLVPQICGRIRDSIYSEQVNLLVGNLPEAASCTKEQWTKTVEAKLAESNERINFLKNPPKSVPEVILKGAREDALSDKYTFLNENGELYVSDVALKAELQSYEALEATYVVREVEGATISNEGYSASFKELLLDKDKQQPFAHKPKGITKFLNESVQCFSDTLKEYCEARDVDNRLLYSLVDVKDDHFNMLYNSLGHAKLKALEYRKSDIERAYKVQEDKHDNRTLIVSLLKLNNNDIIARADVKTKLQLIYDRLGIKDKAKATDINKWFETKDTKVNGKPAFKIIKLK
ncbi:DEAD/DEAH box helicase family protein [Acinetobacter junii]|uniref:DEAD/DEAH box helicase family protein n=1 Tax=Acinetobacter junii TaxID=40215 RepID=UPI003A835DC1